MIRRLASTAIVAATAAAMLAAVPAPAGAAALPLPADATIVLPGHGWGHGRGMGQWGAYGMAQSGSGYRDIVTHYYSNVTLAARPVNDMIRVLVEASPDVVVTSDQPFSIAWSTGNLIATSSDTNKFWRARHDGNAYKVERSNAWNGSWSTIATGTDWVVFSPGTAKMQLVLGSGSVRVYRGSIQARYSTSDGMRSINNVSLDQYLYGSVPRESPASWPAEELKAQAVAARSYAAYKMETAHANGNTFDICATTACQVYMGYATRSSPTGSVTVLESRSTNDAVDATQGQVLTYNGKPILAEYSSSTGGYSAPGSVAYQRAVPDTGDAASPHHDWLTKVKVSEIEKRYPQLGRLVDVKVTSRNGFGDWGGRVDQMQLIGTSGNVTASGYGFSSAFGWPARSGGMQSSWFDVRYWRGEVASAPAAITMKAGDVVTVPFDIRNTGTAPWPVGGVVRLTTAAGSPFASKDWISATRPASVGSNVSDPAKQTVGPGETARFTVPLDASSIGPGDYSQTFGIVADGSSIMAGSFSLAVAVITPWIEEAPNLVANGSFERLTKPWRGAHLTSADGIVQSARHGVHGFRLTGGVTKSIGQGIAFAGSGARSLTFGAWNRASGTSAAGGVIEARAIAHYTNGSSSTWRLSFSKTSHGWTYSEMAFATSATKTLQSIDVTALSGQAAGETTFDAIRLVESPVANGSFERGMTRWTGTGLATGDGVDDEKRDGGHSLAIAGGSGEKRVTQSIAVTGRAFERFVAGVWNTTSGVSSTGGAIALTVTLHYVGGDPQTFWLDIPKADHAWTYAQMPVVASRAFDSADVSAVVADQSGTVHFDAVGFARTWTKDPSFENGAVDWATSAGAAISDVLAHGGAHSLSLAGGGKRVVSQPISLHGAKGKRFVLSALTRTTAPAGDGRLEVALAFIDAHGKKSWVAVPIDRSPHDWSFLEREIATPSDFFSVSIVVNAWDQTATTWIDALQLRSA